MPILALRDCDNRSDHEANNGRNRPVGPCPSKEFPPTNRTLGVSFRLLENGRWFTQLQMNLSDLAWDIFAICKRGRERPDSATSDVRSFASMTL